MKKKIAAALLIPLVAIVAFWIWFTWPAGNEHDSVSLPPKITWLDTGLSDEDKPVWHHLSEGSELMPMSVLEALWNPRAGKPFLYSLADYGFLLKDTDPHNLPVGWTTADRILGGRKVPFVGINCSACHTGELRYRGNTVRIDGAPNLFALEQFFLDLQAAVAAVHTNSVESFKLVRNIVRLNHHVTGAAAAVASSPASLDPLEPADRGNGLSGSGRDPGNQGGGADRTALEDDRDWPPKASAYNGASYDVVHQVPGSAPVKNSYGYDVVHQVPGSAPVGASPLPPMPKSSYNAGSYDVVHQVPGSAPAGASPLPPPPKSSYNGGSYDVVHQVPGSAPAGASPLPPPPKSEIRALFDSLMTSGSYLQRRMSTLEALSQAIHCGVELGPGRGDSFGIIRELLFPFDPVRLDAPVSTPHLFGFGSYHWIHWDGNTQSFMQRNVAQAIALGADYDPVTRRSSVLPQNLHRLETIGRKLKAPAWPESIFGAIDRDRAERGKAVFQQQRCAECHTGEKVYPVAEIGTSPARAVNFDEPLAGRSFPSSLADFGAQTEMVLFQQHDISPRVAKRLEPGRPQWRATGGYIARSLAGIWATAPFLHNGSVPTVYDLLQPAAKRPVRFPVGHREFDPQKLGFIPDAPNPDFVLDTTIQGNGNEGHEFGVTLPEDSKLDLLEYLKTL